jgi:hypothetical protein
MAPPTRRKSPTPCTDGHLTTEPEDVWNWLQAGLATSRIEATPDVPVTESEWPPMT